MPYQQVHPYCARCRHAVQKANIWQEPIHRLVHIVAWCHGEKEERTFADDTAMNGSHQAVMFKPLSPIVVREDERAMPEDDY